MHKFKLIARAKLNTADISENVETKPLQIINESSKIFIRFISNGCPIKNE